MWRRTVGCEGRRWNRARAPRTSPRASRACNRDLRSVLIEAGHRLKRCDSRWSALADQLHQAGKPGSVIAAGSWALLRGSKSDGAAIAFSKHPRGPFRRQTEDARIEEWDAGGRVWEEDRGQDSKSEVAVRAEIEPPAAERSPRKVQSVARWPWPQAGFHRRTAIGMEPSIPARWDGASFRAWSANDTTHPNPKQDNILRETSCRVAAKP